MNLKNKFYLYLKTERVHHKKVSVKKTKFHGTLYSKTKNKIEHYFFTQGTNHKLSTLWIKKRKKKMVMQFSMGW